MIWAWQLCRVDSLHLPRRNPTEVVLKAVIKEKHCAELEEKIKFPVRADIGVRDLPDTKECQPRDSDLRSTTCCSFSEPPLTKLVNLKDPVIVVY